ncbi:hypothetical protein SAMN05421858_2226 [Haladaptatus litoreus]|uniref:Lipoprotein n=1 Tax=Haladaptatus litoreus TaxID=553468 RepID=A0A1N6ZY68_9EURY|nr:hypothetical protein [Haladaptatus litoreus]SIR31689.1 hypothetical protein SAMN05421858_2226 [Haladaptatus litoreus]
MPSKLPVLTLFVATLVLLAGCSDAGFLGGKTDVVTEKKPEEPELVDAVLSGGECVDSPENRVEIAKRTGGGESHLVVAGNVSVPDAAYSLERPELVETGWSNYTLRVSSNRTTEKPKRNCAGLANYTATVRIPDGGPHKQFTLTVVHDGKVIHRENVTSQ